MALFDSINVRSRPSGELREFVARYQRLRPTRMRLNNALVARLGRDVLEEGGQRLGLLRRGVLVFENEDQTSVLMDYCIYDVRRKGRNAVEQYLIDCPPDPDSDEMACLHAMQHATYAVVVVSDVERGVGCRVRNLFTDETRVLVDMGFSQSAEPGAVIATRLLDFGEFVTTGGAALPLGVLPSDELPEWERRFRASVRSDQLDPATLIRECLAHGASSHIVYDEPGAQRQVSRRSGFPQAEAAPRRRESSKKGQSNKPLANRRCRCGSGKMYKNCCGKGKVR